MKPSPALHDEVDAAATYLTEELSLGRGSDARQIQAVAHTPDYFAVLGVQPLLGSWPAGDGRAEPGPAVIGYGLWQQAFGGATDVIGKPLRLGMDTYSIVAVAPRGFVGIDSKPVDVWLPLERRATVAYRRDGRRSCSSFRSLRGSGPASVDRAPAIMPRLYIAPPRPNPRDGRPPKSFSPTFGRRARQVQPFRRGSKCSSLASRSWCCSSRAAMSPACCSFAALAAVASSSSRPLLARAGPGFSAK